MVVCSFYRGELLLSRHRARSTWETQGGDIEPGETPLKAAQRELFEESGVARADIYPVCDYFGYDAVSSANGRVFLAAVHEIGPLPESEMKEVRGFTTLPGNLTYPSVTPVLVARAREYAVQNGIQI